MKRAMRLCTKFNPETLFGFIKTLFTWQYEIREETSNLAFFSMQKLRRSAQKQRIKDLCLS